MEAVGFECLETLMPAERMLDASNVHQLKEIVVVCEAVAQARRLISCWSGQVRLYAIFDRLQEEIRVFEAARRREKAETLSKARDAGELEDRVEALARKESEVRPAEQTTDSTMGTLSSGSRSQRRCSAGTTTSPRS